MVFDFFLQVKILPALWHAVSLLLLQTENQNTNSQQAAAFRGFLLSRSQKFFIEPKEKLNDVITLTLHCKN